MQVDQHIFIPGRHTLAPGEVLAPDTSAYQMLHTLDTAWPCLSCDIIPDHLGDDRKTYPATVYAVAGTQTASGREKENQLMVLKLSQLSKVPQDPENSDDSDSDDDDVDTEPVLETKIIPQSSCTNRIRVFQTPQTTAARVGPTVTASMMETGQVLIHDISTHLASFDTPGTVISQSQNRPVATITAHGKAEGYALDWARPANHPAGLLLTGDIRGRIFATARTESGAFVTDDKPFTSHKGTVEELQWSPSERTVFASGGDDGTVRIWDTRVASRQAVISVQASQSDVNVLSWSARASHLLASGHDDGSWSVWDLRQWKPNNASSIATPPNPLASFDFHKSQITCLEWHPTEDSIVLVGAGDNTLSLWDLAVEYDDEESKDTAGEADIPPHLLFVHYMDEVKEGHWHPQIPGAIFATGGSGFGVFKTISV